MNLDIFTQEGFNKAFAKANEKIHLVETQWHYPVFKKYHWIPETESSEGFVRSYTYFHPKINRRIKFTTGYHADYFEDNGEVIYATSLENYLTKLDKNIV